MDKKPEKLVPEVRFKGFTDDWEQRKLGEISTSFSGGTPSVKNKSYYGGKIPFIRSAEIHKNKTELFITESGLKNSSAKLIKKGTLLYALYGATSGEVDVSNIDGAINQAIMAIFLQKDNVSFIKYYLEKNKDKIIAKYLQGGQGNLSASIIKSVHINLPFTEEQLKISNLIKKVESLISLQQRKLELLKEIKKGLLQKMFADKSKFPILRFEGFHNEWEQRKLKNVYQKIGNAFVGTASPYYVDAGHFYLESNNIKNGQINRNHEVFINNSFYQKQSNKLLHTGDLVMVQSGHVGDTAVITQEYNNSAAHALIVFRNPKDKFLSDYLNFYFQNTSAKNKINILAIGNTIRHVLASDMSRFSVYFPNKDERKYISNLLLKLQYTITLQQSKISQLTILKKYLLQKLFI
ncbi:restriction endonuclease subunit S [Limosilactobacillus reuteri]|uniref:restriction endonuclease subunit S n=1 Tax=Limosilactobacillus reuteri TaxID=1598 RepID=UPI001E60DAAC|nr:restriction endonuclease subunit S [Limosilactobacillus reuteri]MCC4345254.1 restriction endonuclease subunit S [Limosilactobacillus reuteri]